MYRCETTSVVGFVQQLAVQYLAHGYWFYVAGSMPDGKDPRAVDRKLIARYDIAVSKWTRSRRRRGGCASVQYLRHGRFFLLLATHGRHRFFEEERGVIRDARRQPILFAGYSIRFSNGHASVRIAPLEFQVLLDGLLRRCLARSVEDLEQDLATLPFEPYAPVRAQLLQIVRAVNRHRGSAGLATVSWECIRARRRIVHPFGDLTVDTDRKLIENVTETQRARPGVVSSYT